MNQKNIEKMIPFAVEILKSDELGFIEVAENKTGIQSKYFGYLASFGPAVNQAGIVKTLVAYSKEEAESDRKKIALLIKNVLLTSGFMAGQEDNKITLYGLYSNNIKEKTFSERLRVKSRVLECATACKLSMNMFHKIEKEKDENDN